MMDAASGMSSAPPAFHDLIAPLTPADISALWCNRELKLQRGKCENRFRALFDWNTLWRLIEDAVIPPEECRVTYGRRIVAPLFYTEAGKFNPDRLARLFDQGSSMIVFRLEAYVPAISAACRDAAAHGIHIAHAGAIVTTGGTGALDAHYDLQDLIILQVEGSKRWQIFGPRVLKPIKEPASKQPPQAPPVLDAALEAGDILFLPAGYWHLCDNGPARSLHLGLFMKRPKANAT
jgi:Cupin superfamily protein